MCRSCAASWVCACDGGDVFGSCPASKNVGCPICDHYPSGTNLEGSLNLADLLDPAVLAKERAAYEKKQAAQK